MKGFKWPQKNRKKLDLWASKRFLKCPDALKTYFKICRNFNWKEKNENECSSDRSKVKHSTTNRQWHFNEFEEVMLKYIWTTRSTYLLRVQLCFETNLFCVNVWFMRALCFPHVSLIISLKCPVTRHGINKYGEPFADKLKNLIFFLFLV